MAAKSKKVPGRDIRKLPWPGALFEKNRSLSADDSYAVGELIVGKLWGGTIDRYQGSKSWSVRQIHEALGVGSAALFTRSVQVYETANSLKLRRPLTGISTSTLFLLARLPETKRRVVMKRAETETWTRRRLEEEIAKLTRGQKHRGRPRLAGVLKVLNLYSSKSLLAGLDRVSELDKTTARAALEQAMQLERDLHRVRKELERRKSS